MNWDALMWVLLSIFGAALVIGGIVAYRGIQRTGLRALAAAGVAAGIVMWAIVLVTIPVSGTQQGSPEPVQHLQGPALNEH